MRFILLLASVLACSCTLTMDYHQCIQDSDCVGTDGTPQY